MITKALLLALIMCESSGNPAAMSGAGAQGLTQLTPIGVLEVQLQYNLPEPDDILDPNVNVLYGALLLEHYYKTTGSVKGALIAYNGGYRAFHAWRRHEPIPEETVIYVRRVMALRWELDPTFFRIPNQAPNDLEKLIDTALENFSSSFSL